MRKWMDTSKRKNMSKWMQCTAALCIFVGLFAAQASAENLLSSQNAFPGQTAKYGLTLANSDTRPHSYTLQALQLPQGFNPVFFQGDRLAGKPKILPGQQMSFTLEIAIPETVRGNNYQFQAKVTRDDNSQSTLPLNLMVDDSYRLKIVSSSSNLTAFSGKSFTFPITINNFGGKALTSVKANLELPPKWQATITPASLDSLGPGKSATFQTTVTLPPTQDAGNQKIKLTAVANQVSSEAVTIPVTTEKSTSYLAVPIVIVGLVLGGGLLFLKKQGRR